VTRSFVADGPDTLGKRSDAKLNGEFTFVKVPASSTKPTNPPAYLQTKAPQAQRPLGMRRLFHSRGMA
jgi:hypothetical protein